MARNLSPRLKSALTWLVMPVVWADAILTWALARLAGIVTYPLRLLGRPLRTLTAVASKGSSGGTALPEARIIPRD